MIRPLPASLPRSGGEDRDEAIDGMLDQLTRSPNDDVAPKARDLHSPWRRIRAA